MKVTFDPTQCMEIGENIVQAIKRKYSSLNVLYDYIIIYEDLPKNNRNGCMTLFLWVGPV